METFEQEVVSLRPFLVKRAYKLINHMPDAEDLSHDAIASALFNKQQFTEGTNLRAWVYSIHNNLVFEYWRRSRIRWHLPINNEILEDAAMTVKEGQLMRVALTQAVARARSLSFDQWQIFVSLALGETTDEAAKRLCLPRGTVKSRTSRLRNVLNGQSVDAPAVQKSRALKMREIRARGGGMCRCRGKTHSFYCRNRTSPP